MNKEIENYLESVPVNRKERFNNLHSLIIEIYPSAVVDMSYKMPTYKVDKGWVALANQKNYLSLYTCNCQHIELFKKNNPKIKTGKGCINFKDKDELPLKDLREVIRLAIEHPN